MHQRLELARHHEIDEKDGEADGKRQAREGTLHLLALPREPGGDPRGEPQPGDGGPDGLGGAGEVHPVEVARDHHRGTLAHPAEFGRSLAELGVPERAERHRARSLGVHDEFGHRGGVRAEVLAAPHHDVDPPVALVEPGGDLAAELGAKPFGRLVHRQSEARQAIGGESDPDLRTPRLGGRTHVGEPGDPGDGRLHPAGARHQQRAVLGKDLDLDGLADAEVGRPAELVADPRPLREAGPDPLDRGRLGLLVTPVRHDHLDPALVLGASRAAREAASGGGARFGGHPEHSREVERGGAHTVHHRIGRGHRGSLREVDVEVELALGERRNEFDADGGSSDGERSGEEPGRQREDGQRVAEGGAQHRRIGARDRGLGPSKGPQQRPQRKDDDAPDLAKTRADPA